MRQLLLVIAAMLLMFGCSLGDSGIGYRTPITHIQLDFGLPDVISDSSGDLARFYVPSDRPESEWPANAPRTFYYIERNLQVVFINGKAVKAHDIESDLRESVLMPLLDRMSKANTH